ncbi:peroxidase 57 [Cinnamomum micranthum f. kanehirae]|uniref:Peroxidase 57 n=1 Tax=Cinnamomum micranthum f. kanehirae TaxID=337451 RepID=A0A443PRN9_9MAGN|nr:peroxidase 57 [Cinnamomum micranthum f. kanehirae]
MSAFIRALLSLALLLNPSFTLEVNFYRHSCPQAEYAVKGTVKQHFQRDPSVPAGLLRLHFHDCIIRVRSELERRCLGIVSCADILALAARDGVALAGGDDYALPTGRRDGFVSSIT